MLKDSTPGIISPKANYHQITDHLCQVCLSLDLEFPRSELAVILCDDLDTSSDRAHSILVDPENPTGCRLCALLISRFSKTSDRKEPFKIKYGVALRYGYIMEIRDLVFRPEDGDAVVRLSLQPHSKS
jgi:hypothetical protein